jgi:hypothetical protein
LVGGRGKRGRWKYGEAERREIRSRIVIPDRKICTPQQ